MAGYNLGTAAGRIIIDGDPARAGFDVARGAAEGFFSAVEDRINGVRELGTKLTAVGAAGVAGFGVAVNTAANFEQAISNVSAVSLDAKDKMGLISETALRIGKDTSFSATEAANAMEELVKAGISVDDVLNGAADAAVALAAAGGVSIPEAASIASNAMNQFNLTAAELPGVVDIIAGAANASAIDVGELGTSLSQVGAVANLAGLSFKDTAIAVAEMGNAGIKGSDAGTSLKTMLTNLIPTTNQQIEKFREMGLLTFNAENAMKALSSNGVKPLGTDSATLNGQLRTLAADLSGSEVGSAKANKAYTKLATSTGALKNEFFDMEGNLRPLNEIQGLLATSTAGMTKEQKLANLEILFGSDAIRAAAVLADEGAGGYARLAAEMGKVSAADVARERLNNLKGAVEQLKGSFETAMIIIGRTFLPIVRKIVEGVTSLVNVFNNLPAGVQAAVAVVFGLGTALTLLAGLAISLAFALGPLIARFLAFRALASVGSIFVTFFRALTGGAGIVGAFSSAFARAGAVFTRFVSIGRLLYNSFMLIRGAMLLLSGPVGIVIAAMVAIGAAVYLAYQRFTPFREAVNQVGAAISSALAPAVAGIKAIFASLSATFTSVAARVGTFVTQLRGYFSSLVPIFTATIIPAINTLKAAFMTLVQTAIQVGTGILNTVRPAFQGLVAQVTPIVAKIREFASGATAAGGPIQRLGAFISGTVVPALAAFGRFLAANVLPALAAVGAFVVGTFLPAFLKVAGFFAGVFLTAVINGVRGVVQAIQGAFQIINGVFNVFKGLLTGNWSQLWNGLKGIATGAFNLIVGAVKAFLNLSVLRVFSLGFAALRGIVTAGWAALRGVFSAGIGFLRTVVSTGLNAVRSVFGSIWGGIRSVVTSAINGVRAGISAGMNAIRSVVTSVLNGVRSVFSSIWNSIRPIVMGAVNGVRGAISTGLGAIRAVVSAILNGVRAAFSAAWNAIRSVVSSAVSAVRSAVSTGLGAIRGVVSGILSGVRSAFSVAWSAIRAVVTGAVSGVRAAVSGGLGAVRGIVSGILSGVRAAFTSAWSAIRSAVTSAVSAVRSAISTGLNAARAAASAAINGIRSAVSTGFNAARSVASSVMNAIRSVISSGFNAARSVVSSVMSAIRSVISSGFNAARSVVSSVMNAIRSVISSGFNGARGVVSSVMSAIRSVISSGFNAARGVVSSVMSAIRSVISSGFNAARSTVSSVMSAVRSVISAGFNAARSVVSSVMSAIRSVITAGFNAARAAVSAAMSAVRSAISAAFNAAKSLVSGAMSAISSAVSGGVSRVVGFMRGLPGQMQSALGNLGGLLTGAGRDLIDGLLGGISSAFGKVKAKLGELTGMLPDWKGPKRLDLRLLFPTGQYIMRGLIKGIESSTGELKNKLNSITTVIDRAVGRARAARDTRGLAALLPLQRYLNARNNQMLAYAKQREGIRDRIKKAEAGLKESLKAQLEARDKARESITDAARGLFDFTKQSASSAFILDTRTIIARMEASLQKVIDFRKKIQRLTALGLNQETLGQIVNAGVETGSAYAQSLLNSGAAGIAQINSLQGKVTSETDRLGQFASNAMYDAGIKAAQGLVDGLKRQETAITRQMENIAAAMVTTIKRALGIRSPSRVMIEMGRNTSLGFVRGLAANQRALERAAANLSSVPIGLATTTPDPVVPRGLGRVRPGNSGEAPGHNKIEVTVNAPQNMSPDEVGLMTARRIGHSVLSNTSRPLAPVGG